MSDLKWQDAVSYSHNFATAKPDILPMEKEHILGLCKVLERIGSQRDELYSALTELDEAYCRAGCELTREDRTEDRQRLIKARAALAKAGGEPCDTAE